MTRTLSHSESETFVQCERKHFYSYGLKLQRKGMSDALKRGVAGHSFLEQYFTEQKRLQEAGEWDASTSPEGLQRALAEEVVDEMGTTPEGLEMLRLMKNFFDNQPFSNWRIIAVEYEYCFEVNDDFKIPGFIDLVAEDLLGNVWVIDYKFSYDFFSEIVKEELPQLPRYIAALRVSGMQVDKAGYVEIRTRKLKNNDPGMVFRFEEVPVSDARVKRTFKEQMIIGQRITDRHNLGVEEWHDTAIRTANKMSCEHCPFIDLCVAELNENPHAQLIMDAEFQQKTRR